MTAPYVPALKAAPHDRVLQEIRDNGPGPFPADATRVSSRHVPLPSAKAVGKQFVRGLAESGLGALELLGSAEDVFTGQALSPYGARAQVDRLLKHTHEQINDYYGTSSTDEEAAANILGNLTGGAAIGGLGKIPLTRVASEASPLRSIPETGGRGFEVTGVRATPTVPVHQPTLAEMTGMTALQHERVTPGSIKDIIRVLGNEQGSVPAPEIPKFTMPPREFDEILNRAIFGRPNGPMVHPAREVLPGLENVPVKMNRLLAADEMAARARASRTGIGRLSNDLARVETRQANNMLREAIMRNENPLGYEDPLTGRAPGDRLRIVNFTRFLRGMSKQ